VSGEETAVVATSAEEKRGVISPDGSKLAFDRFENNKRSLYWMPLPTGPETKICDDSLSLLQWTPDSQGVLISEANRVQVVVHDIATGKRVAPAVHPQFEVHSPAFSPDGRWLALTLKKHDHRSRVYVSPWLKTRPTQIGEWIPISGQGDINRSFWPPDGNIVYYYQLDSFEQGSCLFARRLDPVTKCPLGKEFAVRHFHDNLSPVLGYVGYGLTPDALYLTMNERNAHIWVAELHGDTAK
jgi:WD40 repeat protein